jgi:hypothetical protein
MLKNSIVVGAATATLVFVSALKEVVVPSSSAWFQEKQFSSERIEENTFDASIVKKHTDQGSIVFDQYGQVSVDMKASGPPEMDDYPKSPPNTELNLSDSNKQFGWLSPDS